MTAIMCTLCEIKFFQQNRKNLKLVARMKKVVFKKNRFWWKFWKKLIFEQRFFFQSHSSTQNIKNMVVDKMVPWWWSEIPKYIDSFCIFLEPVRTIRHNTSMELDLSCPELFFWIYCCSYSVPNGIICFGSFFLHFRYFCRFSLFLIIFCSNFDNFAH